MSPVQPPNQPPVQIQISHENWIKEVVAALIALPIIGVTTYFLLTSFDSADPARWQHYSSILQVAVGLAGAVTGYYFGRIPAERAAATAQQAASNAQIGLVQSSVLAQKATADNDRIRRQVADLLSQVSTPTGGGSTGVNTLHIKQSLEDILRG